MKSLQDRIAVVTGAASGIGRATSLALARAGCDLALADLDETGLAETARGVEAIGRKATTHRVDVADREAMTAFAEAAEQAHGRIHIVVNNAGVAVFGKFEDQSLDDIEWLLDINVRGVVFGSKLFLPALKRAGEGHIVNVSSLAGLVPFHGFSSYSTAKFAVRGLSECIRMELHEHGIGVTVVHPGTINTNIPRAARTAAPDAEDQRQKGIEAFERVGRPPEVVARKIVRAIERNQQRVLVGWETYLLSFLKRMFPTALDATVGAISRRISPL